MNYYDSGSTKSGSVDFPAADVPIDKLPEPVLRSIRVLLGGFRANAVSADPQDYKDFEEQVRNVESRLAEGLTPDELMMVTGKAIQAMEDHSRRVRRFIAAKDEEIVQTVKTMADMAESLYKDTQQGQDNLRAVQEKLESTLTVQNLQTIRQAVSDCTEKIKKEAERQKEQAAKVTTEIQATLVAKQSGAPAQVPVSVDDVTGLPGAAEAEKAMAAAMEASPGSFAALLVVRQMRSLNLRFGFKVGDRLLQAFANHVAQQLGEGDRLFRWRGPSLILMMTRDNLAEAQQEASRVGSVRLERMIEIGERSALVSLSGSSMVVQLSDAGTVSQLTEKLETALRRAQ